MLSLPTIAGFDGSEEAVQARLDVAVAALRTAGIDVVHTRRKNFFDAEFIIYLYIDRDPDGCAKAEVLIADALVQAFDDSGQDVFTITCMPLLQ